MKKIRKDWLARVAEYISYWAGSRYSLIVAIGLLIFWIASGEAFEYSEGWLLALSVGSAIVTFLMVFLIQNTQNRNLKIIHIKLDELIRNTKGANTAVMDLNDFTEEELENIRDKYEEIAAETRKEIHKDSGIVDALFQPDFGAVVKKTKKPAGKKKAAK